MAKLSDLGISKDLNSSRESIQESRERMDRYLKAYCHDVQNLARGLNRQMRSFDEPIRQLLGCLNRIDSALHEPLTNLAARVNDLDRLLTPISLQLQYFAKQHAKSISSSTTRASAILRNLNIDDFPSMTMTDLSDYLYAHGVHCSEIGGGYVFQKRRDYHTFDFPIDREQMLSHGQVREILTYFDLPV